MQQIDLSTSRLHLRLPALNDAEAMLVLRNDLVANKFVPTKTFANLDESKEYLNQRIEDVTSGKSYYWVIAKADSKEVCIGYICFWNLSADRKTGEVGYKLMPKFHNQGIMSEALEAVIEFGFRKIGFACIEAFTMTENIASTSILKKQKFILNENRKEEDSEALIIFELKKL